MTLAALRCPRCGLTAFPLADRCPRCADREVTRVELATTGVVEAVTTGGDTGYLAEVRTDDGVRVLGRVQATSAPAVGDRVRHVPGPVVEFEPEVR